MASRKGDRYYEDLYGKRNGEDAGDKCKSESDNDEDVTGVRNKQRAMDSYGRIEMREDSGLSNMDGDAPESHAESQEVNAPKYKISPSQNAKHSIGMARQTPHGVNAKLKAHKFGMFGDHASRSHDKWKRRSRLKDRKRDDGLQPRTDPRAKTLIFISDDEPSSDDEIFDERDAEALPRFVMRDEVLAAAARANKKWTSRRPGHKKMNTIHVDLSNEVAPRLEDSESESSTKEKRKDLKAPDKFVYSRLQKHPYVLDDAGDVAAQARADGAGESARLLAKDGKKSFFVNWKGEVMWLPIGTGVVVIENV